MEHGTQNNSKTKIKAFTDLIVWQESHKLVLVIYNITKTFPKEELFGLTSQMRRAAVSVTSNIAEGFTRKSKREKLQFYFIAKGSLTELQSQLLVARDILYITKDDFSGVYDQASTAERILSAFIKKTDTL
ncbi:MAG: S23 ribosomal protein [Parcubacteria group bacterium GW2011_GWA1_47_8]|nr:MAG: S23 ribosomal protein [Parcubacteria group bacterium GW2011_GWA1_47_8]